ncbi:MAG: N(4)-(beta-N-acetylglucosaminyl)-L-asparaginase [Aureispira sp.]|nr:N(4)-(beta-N-acetylglucosaminyl)-L-asparaginase [Aureispira sp.]
MRRRKFLEWAALSSFLGFSNKSWATSPSLGQEECKKWEKPLVISTWNHGMDANAAAWELLSKGGKALDAVEKGVMVTESDPTNRSVGIGGTPDRDGHVTLDACIMNEEGDCGSVAFLEDIENPIAVARMVMEKTPHVMLAGKGAQLFALQNGFERKDLLIPETKAAWEKWKKTSNYETPVNIENHDTIGMIALDQAGDFSGACTTSGLAYKMHGRVGDSPIIGASLFVDNEVGAACATGVGEMVIRIVGSHLIVELMRQGYSPEKACKKAIERIMAKHKSVEGQQVGFLAIDRKGRHGGYSIYNGFNYALRTPERNEMVETKYMKKW